MGVMLTMTMIMITGLAITRERERGTMENLLSMPTRPIEVMIGKIVPYIVVGYIQVALILSRRASFSMCRCIGSIPLLLRRRARLHRGESRGGHHVFHVAQEPAAGDADGVLLLPAVDPALGLHVSVSRHAATGRSGSAKCLPLTHFLRIVRGILLKGNGLAEVAPRLWPLAALRSRSR